MLIQLVGFLMMVLTLVIWIVVIQAILSWLVAFNVINTSSDFVRSFLMALDRMTAPIYRPIRKVLPDFGGLDFSPLVVLLLIKAIQIVIRSSLTDMSF